ncbi:MAG: hypothetical protein H6711_27460 [Myxococcales bacterium]|nr:hypothetical protein [Myxococcales bacterium]
MESRQSHVEAVRTLWYGRQEVPRGADLGLAWRAVKAIAASDGILSGPEAECLLARMASLLTEPAVIDAVVAWDFRGVAPVELLDRVAATGADRREVGAWIIYNGLAVSVADGELADGEMAAVLDVARTMDIDEVTVATLHQLVIDEAALRRRRLAILHGEEIREPGFVAR